MAQLFAFREDRLGFRYSLDNSAILGRAPECDLILFDRSASRKHALISLTDEGDFYIEDLSSTNGTLINYKPISEKTLLNKYDSIKIGQEIFIFDPDIDVVVGPAPSALIINKLEESIEKDFELSAVSYLAKQAASAHSALLVDLADQLFNLESQSDLMPILIKFLENNFGATFISILWPNRGAFKRLSAITAFPNNKRLLLSGSIYKAVLEDGLVAFLPKVISELDFNDGQRIINFAEQKALAGPLFSEHGKKGLLYIENSNREFTIEERNFFASFLLTISSPLTSYYNSNHDELIQSLHTEKAEDMGYNLINRDEQMKVIYSTALQVANTSSIVMLKGETGTGKSALASYIHRNSQRRDCHFIDVTLSNILPAQMEQVLFGIISEDDNDPNQIGMMEMADGGTLFLRHIEYLTLQAQKIVLMAIEEGLFFPLGSRRSRAIDVRIITSTSADLWSLVESGHFREDLYLRLNQFNMYIPPLREMKDDIPVLVNQFMGQMAKEMGLSYDGIDESALECLRSYPWPGNVAELKQEAQLLALFNRNGRVTLEDLPLHLRLAPEIYINEKEEPNTLIWETERYILIRALARFYGDIEKVGMVLGLKPEDVIIRMRFFGLEALDYQAPIAQAIPKGPGQTSVPIE